MAAGLVVSAAEAAAVSVAVVDLAVDFHPVAARVAAGNHGIA